MYIYMYIQWHHSFGLPRAGLTAMPCSEPTAGKLTQKWRDTLFSQVISAYVSHSVTSSTIYIIIYMYILVFFILCPLQLTYTLPYSNVMMVEMYSDAMRCDAMRCDAMGYRYLQIGYN